MNPLTDFLQHPVTARLGWTLLHFVWQGALLAAGFALARSAWRGRSANARYLAGCLTLSLMVGAAVGTFMLLGDAP
ncbi:MAG: M56 family metallopeptidase, partial [Limisphaerales bacterium]